YYMEYDKQPSRFPLAKKVRKGKAIPIGSDVMLDQERCVLCARCTRFFDEVTHTGELAIFNRGDHNQIDIYPDHPVDNKYAGNVIDICPVGALTEKDFRFRMRVWYLHRAPSVCGGCERGCSIDIHHHRARIYRYKPRYNPEVNSYWMCDEGRHHFTALQNETRLISPMVQEGDRMRPEEWGVAVRQLAANIENIKKSYGPNAIAAVIGAKATNEEAFALKRLMRDTIGSDRVVMVSFTPLGMSGDDNLLIRANKNPNTRGLEALGLAANQLGALAKAVADGELKMLIVLRADLVRVMGEAEFVRSFGALEYLAVLDTDVNETVQMANQVLAIGAYPETAGSFTNFKGQVQRLAQAFPPPGNALTGLEAIARLGHAIDGNARATDAGIIFNEIAASEAPFAGMSFDALMPHGLALKDTAG
ncbi:MAG TPA: molybdopterin-dependent oxidoreductase, partial [Candidatus Binataceae bacterium]|nr:molybdopterin-dependent oxidoreductase [Candidatus Binataceae bacterium]